MSALAFRRGESRDMRFVIASWADSFRDAASAGVIPMHLYDGIYRDQIIPWILARPGVEVWVAFHPEETDDRHDLHGYIVVERDAELLVRVAERCNGRRRWVDWLEPANQPFVHWVFVKQPKRGFGIARGLFDAAGIDPTKPFLFSFKGASWPRLRKRAPCATWAPMVARWPKRLPMRQSTP